MAVINLIKKKGINPQTKATLYFPQWTRRSTDTERLDDTQRRASSTDTENDGCCGESRSESGKMSGQDIGQMGEPQFNGGVWWFRGSEAGRREEADCCGERWANFPSVSPVHRGNDVLLFLLNTN